MLEKIILFLLYYFGGFAGAVILCAVLGLALATLLALVKAFSRPHNLFYVLGYATSALAFYALLWAGSALELWLGNHTHHAGQTGLLIGAIFPGVLALAIIPHFLIVAWKQTSGLPVE